MVCKELLRNSRSNAEVDFDRFANLQMDGRRLISGWFDRAWRMRDCERDDCFEAFIFAWFAVNSWASCVTGEDQERAYLDALTLDTSLSERFEQLMFDTNSRLAIHAKAFSQFWPIFKVQDIRQKGLGIWQTGEREEIIRRYMDGGVRKFAPKCWQRHRDTDERVPVDWPHTLAALYQVRCNLFHGEKAAHSEMDQRIVASAFKVLVHFFREATYL